jgi:Ras-related protein Rab-23
MHEEDMELAVKVLIVGNGAVGKSSLIQRYCKGIYTNEYKKTIGVDFLEKQISIGAPNGGSSEQLRLMIWDTAGQEEFDSITRAYYRDAAACVVAFSTTDIGSFNAVESWIKKVEDEVGSISMVLIQNKCDLIDQAVMSKEQAEALAEKVKLKFFRVSVQENFKVDDVFQYLADLYIKKLKERDQGTERVAVPASNTAMPAKVDFTTKAALPAKGNGGFKIEQPKRRTGGKKSKFDCVLL